MPCAFAGTENASADGAAYVYATDNKVLAACDCIQDNAMKNSCKTSVLNILQYSQAISTFDLAACDDIEDPIAKDSCKLVVSSGVDYLNQNDKLFLAEAYIHDQEWGKAVDLLESLLAENPNDAEILTDISMTYSDLGMITYETETYMPKALEAVNMALNISESPRAYYAKAFAYETGGDYVSAINAYSELIAKYPDYVKGYFGRGHAYNKLSDLTAAIADFEKAKELDTGRTQLGVYSQLCRVYANIDKYLQQAVDNCQIAINLSSQYSNSDEKMGVRIVLAELYMRVERYTEAYSQIQTALTILPNSPDALITLARWYVMTEDYASSEETAESLLEIDSMRAAGYSVLAFARYQQGDFDGAIEAALKGVEVITNDVSLLPPNRPPVKRDMYYILANAYTAKGDFTNAKKYAELGDALA